MKKAILNLSLIFLTLSLAQSIAKAEPVNDKYHLVWRDEFNTGDRPNPKYWGYDTYANKLKWWHNERQYYTDDRRKNVRIENGNLIIEAHLESLKGQSGWVDQDYSSARLYTKGRLSFTYGFFEIRAKLPCAVGAWPALWMLSEAPKDQWPDQGEIDIMEQVGFDPTKIHATLHTRSSFDAKRHQSGTVTINDACQAFHNYQMDWQADKITMLLDNVPYYTMVKPIYNTKTNNTKANETKEWPFDHPFYLLMNVAVGGAWGAQKGIKPEQFPVRMEVDYIRVYQDKK